MSTTQSALTEFGVPLAFFVALNVGLLITGALLWWQNSQRRLGYILLGSAIVLLLGLAFFAPQLTTPISNNLELNQLPLIQQISLFFRIFFRQPGIAPHLTVAFMVLLAWLLDPSIRRNQIILGLMLLGLAVWMFIPAWRIEDLVPGPVIAGLGIVAITARLLPQFAWAAILPVLVAAATLAQLAIDSGANPVAQEEALGIELPAGFSLNIYQELGETPTALAFGDDGALLVSTLQGNVHTLHDTDQDGEVDEQVLYIADVGVPLGLATHEDLVFISTHRADPYTGSILRTEDTDGDGLADQQTEIISGLPNGLYTEHQNNDLEVGPDGRLYFTVGSTTDHSEEPEPLAAKIHVIDLDGENLETYATGVRNPYGLAFLPDGRLFATDNGPDQLDETLLYVPAEELNLIVEGGDYGFPDYPPGHDSILPIANFLVHSVPTGLTGYTNTVFPAEYQDSLFVTLWLEHKVMQVKLIESEDGLSTEVSDFITGLGLPLDIIEGPNGELYLADMQFNTIYRVTYNP
ncbi:MAG: hypothetical protein DWQ07_15310 [Chloroflexi bacterium]|nr:MAG: hypothetical protein DWQ07_15310 [Chloroflexota bacterium]MBL1196412.1 hypothetical protein [Chloroflexota bacterium]NOH13707.1 hypothetical protein [Chloroflexota bacterium]